MAIFLHSIACHRSQTKLFNAALCTKDAESTLVHEAVLVTGHKDGTLRVWFMDSDIAHATEPTDKPKLSVSLLLGHVLVSGFSSPVTCLLVCGLLPASLAASSSCRCQ